jgi:Flp pilus assembly pilin Flp
MLPLTVAAQAALIHLLARIRDDRGQTTAEYALVLLGAAAIALILVAWATKTDKVTRLFNAVIDRVLSQVS